ncbi:Uncharacterised protein [Chlamydia trachomatis]|nr:Uncharacterised protein [Chlamydia trachomatis]
MSALVAAGVSTKQLPKNSIEPSFCAPNNAPLFLPSPLIVESVSTTLPVFTLRPPVPPLLNTSVEFVTLISLSWAPTEIPAVEPAFAVIVESLMVELP